MAAQSELLGHFHDLLRKFETGILVTHSAKGTLHGRPMAVVQVEMVLRQGCDLWFMTGLDTPKMDEIRVNEQVLVTFQNRNDQFLTLSGRAEVVRDPQKVDDLWRESFKQWFPQGQADLNLILIRVRAEHGEYWDQGGLNKISFGLEALTAQGQGRTMDI